MSQMASFTDGGRTVDRTNWANTFISYYPYGGAVALGLDLTLRDRSNGQVSLDDFMRAMWRAHGKPGGSRPGYVDRPYTLDDAERRLAEVSDAAFARDFFRRYIHGRELIDYPRLLSRAGLTLRKTAPGRAWWGDVRFDSRAGVRVAVTPPGNSPLYRGGVDVDDEIKSIDGTRIATSGDIASALARRKPGDVVTVEFTDRSGAARTARVTLAEDPADELVELPTVTPAQLAFRRAWLHQ
jgi:predicted metalloprotease with PDZ domain